MEIENSFVCNSF